MRIRILFLASYLFFFARADAEACDLLCRGGSNGSHHSGYQAIKPSSNISRPVYRNFGNQPVRRYYERHYEPRDQANRSWGTQGESRSLRSNPWGTSSESRFRGRYNPRNIRSYTHYPHRSTRTPTVESTLVQKRKESARNLVALMNSKPTENEMVRLVPEGTNLYVRNYVNFAGDTTPITALEATTQKLEVGKADIARQAGSTDSSNPTNPSQ